MTRKALNTNWKERDRLVFRDEPPNYMGGCAWYKGLHLVVLRELIANGYADPDETQNASPTISEFADLMEKHPLMTAHGYAVSLERDDYRFSVEGVAGIVEGVAGLFDVLQLCREADEFDVEQTAPPEHMVEAFKFRAWWD